MTEEDFEWAHEKLRWLMAQFLRNLEDKRAEVTFLVTADQALRQRTAEAIRDWL